MNNEVIIAKIYRFMDYNILFGVRNILSGIFHYRKMNQNITIFHILSIIDF